MKLKFFTTILFTAAALLSLQAQSTYSELYDIMQIKCTGCHGGGSPQGNLDLSGSETEVYNAIVGVTPTNPAAAAKWKIVSAGYPERSYLLHKLSANGWDDSYSVAQAEGDVMPPNNLPKLEKKEIELFRQWILFGAPQNDQVINPQLLEDYYDNGLALETIDPIAAPDPGEGFQIRLGPIFLGPGEELEYFKKHDLDVSGGFEINELKAHFNNESHHFILYQIGTQLANSYSEGLRNIYDSENSMLQNTLIAAWQDEGEYKLPQYTAYKVENGAYLDLNYHIKNYDVNNVLGAEVYINVYTQPEGTAIKEMYSSLFPINLIQTFLGQPLGSGLVIPPGGDETVFTEHLWIPDVPGVPFPTGNWHIWQLSTHTHARGTDYDIYIADGGEKGEQIFEGFYNFDYTFNQGFYDWEHPPIRFFEPMIEVDMSSAGGLVHEAKYVNNGDETLYWGNTTDDEMMLIFCHFTDGPVPTSLEEISLVETNNFKVSPNPYQAETNISYKLEKKSNVSLEVYNMLGERIISLVNDTQTPGYFEYPFNSKDLGLTNGMYLVQLNIDGQTSTTKIVEMD